MRFLRELLIYRLEILTTYYTGWRQYSAKISSDYLYFVKRKKIFFEKGDFLSDIITGVSHFLLSQRESFVTVKIFESMILMNFDVFEVPESE